LSTCVTCASTVRIDRSCRSAFSLFVRPSATRTVPSCSRCLSVTAQVALLQAPLDCGEWDLDRLRSTALPVVRENRVGEVGFDRAFGLGEGMLRRVTPHHADAHASPLLIACHRFTHCTRDPATPSLLGSAHAASNHHIATRRPVPRRELRTLHCRACSTRRTRGQPTAARNVRRLLLRVRHGNHLRAR
jgi:hypothetical protein